MGEIVGVSRRVLHYETRVHKRLDGAVSHGLFKTAGIAEQPQIEGAPYNRRQLQKVPGLVTQAAEPGLDQGPYAGWHHALSQRLAV